MKQENLRTVVKDSKQILHEFILKRLQQFANARTFLLSNCSNFGDRKSTLSISVQQHFILQTIRNFVFLFVKFKISFVR